VTAAENTGQTPWWRSRDVIALTALTLLWLLFFWRLFAPSVNDRVQLVDGDFSGQFVAFGAYQYSRFADGEVPLWNPYNNAGLPFIADTQAAVFYPPRLATIAISSLTGGWTYNALQAEMALHVLFYTFAMYALIRRLTLDSPHSPWAGFVAAIVAGYGGYLSGYPPLQLALLEAGVWLPLALLGVLEATRVEKIDWRWLAVSGFALGLSWLAGHPQTSWFATYMLVAFYGYRVYVRRDGWLNFIGGTALIGVITLGIVAVQFLPGLEYQARSMRSGLDFEAKGGGFPIQDVIQFLFPGIMSVWSPLYVGVAGGVLALLGAAHGRRGAYFWAGAAMLALGMSFGRNTALFHALYNVLPGLSFFRGQERAAYVVANALAILSGLGTVYLFEVLPTDASVRATLKRALLVLSGTCAVITVLVTGGWFAEPDSFFYVVGPVAFSTVIAGGLALLVWSDRLLASGGWWRWLLVGLVVFELFSVNIDNDNYEPAADNPLAPPPLVATVQADDSGVFRVDGNFHGLYGNYASLYGLMDIRGISPLFLDGPHAIIQRELPSEVAWELFAVRYVFTSSDQIPAPSELVAQDDYREQTVFLHRLTDPRPFALLMYDIAVADSDSFARALLADPNFDPRRSVILERAPEVAIVPSEGVSGTAEVTSFEPERIVVSVDAPAPAVLSLAHVDYPGWRAELDGEKVDLLRAYGGLTAVVVPEGTHTLTLTYRPDSYRIGAVLSLFTWLGLSILGAAQVGRMIWRRRAGDARHTGK
jgi:hypothetical protein